MMYYKCEITILYVADGLYNIVYYNIHLMMLTYKIFSNV
jgi:hypothetical protein